MKVPGVRHLLSVSNTHWKNRYFRSAFLLQAQLHNQYGRAVHRHVHDDVHADAKATVLVNQRSRTPKPYSFFNGKSPLLTPSLQNNVAPVSRTFLNLCRRYHDDNRRGDEDPDKPRVKGVVITLPNPLDWFRNMWHMWNIKQLDPHFRLDEFMHGALQAVTIVTRHISQKDFDSLEGLLTGDTVVDLKEKLHYEEARHLTNVSIEESDIVYKKAKTWKVVKEDENCQKLQVDTYFVALKNDADAGDTYMLEIGFNFSRNYQNSEPSDWIIDGVSRFQVREFQSWKPGEPQ